MKQLPNFFTLLNLVFGCLAIVFILQQNILLLPLDGDGNIVITPAATSKYAGANLDGFNIYWAGSSC